MSGIWQILRIHSDMAFANNPFLKLHVDKWKEYGVKNRVLKLVEEFRGKIEAKNPDIYDEVK